MVITEINASERSKDKNVVRNYDMEENEEPLFKKGHHNALYKILKSNPLDLANDYFLKILKKLNFREQYHELQWWSTYIWANVVMRGLWNLKKEFVHNRIFPEFGGAIIVSNHSSHIDPFFLSGSIQRRVYWMSKEENFQTPIVKTLFKNLGAFKLVRGSGDQKAWEKAKDAIRNGGVVGIFPEGTRSADGSMGEYRSGAVRLAVEMSAELGYPVPIVPCAVLGSRDALPKGKLVMKPAHVTVRIGKPFYYNEHIKDFSYPIARKLAAELRQEVLDLMEGNYKKENDAKNMELSIGSPKDIESKPKSNSPLKMLKKFGVDILKLVDDAWYSMLKSAEVFNLRDTIGELIYNASGEFVQQLCNLMSPYRTIDYEKYLPDVEGGAIICSNHNSEMDVILLATTFQQRKQYVHQMAKDSLHRIPIVNAWVRTCRAFPLARGENDVGSYTYGLERLAMGERVIIYPEGTTNSGGGNLLPGHTGAMRMAIEAQVPIILVGITGTENVFPKHAKMLNFNRGCYLKMGEVFLEHKKHWGKEMPGYEELKRLTNSMMLKIKDLLVYDMPDM